MPNLSAAEKMKRMRARLAPVSLLIALTVATPAIWVVMELVAVAGDPIGWIIDEWNNQPAQLFAFPFELVAALTGVFALYRIRPEKPNELFYMGIGFSGLRGH